MEARDEATRFLAELIERRNPSHVFALFSGGHDSLCSTHLASRHPRFSAVVHINTEIGIERTREFARQTCRDYGWPLLELKPPRPPFQDKFGQPWGEPGQTAYEAMVCRWGFPGPSGHRIMYQRLKERCLRQLIREHRQPGRAIVLVTGVRKQESKKRMGYVVREQVMEGRIWAAPLAEWGEEDKRLYRESEGLPTNDVAKRLCMSGECTCGSYARPEELAEIRAVCPQTAAYIDRLQVLVRQAGQARSRWGEKPPPTRRKKKADPKQVFLPLCESCEDRHALEEEETNR